MVRSVLALIAVLVLATGYFVARCYNDYQRPLSPDAVRLGVIRDFPTACETAFPILISKLRANPSSATVAVDWHPMSFWEYLVSSHLAPGGYCELYFNREAGRFAAFEPVNGPTYFDWRGVTPVILLQLEDARVPFTEFQRHGCKWALP